MKTDLALLRLSRVRQPLAGGFFTTGAAGVDDALSGGLAIGRMHEIYAADWLDAGSTIGFSLLLAKRGGLSGKPLLWARQDKDVREGGAVYTPGWAELGIDPGDCLFVQAPDPMMLLRASVDAARCNGIGMVVIEARGVFRQIDLTASRRMQLAAENSGVTILLLRIGATAQSSAADTRWSVAAAPSRSLETDAPGAPSFDVELLRQRAGPSGMKWRLEWNYEQSAFSEIAVPGFVVSVPVRRSPADTGSTPQHRAA